MVVTPKERPYEGWDDVNLLIYTNIVLAVMDL